MEKKEYLGKYIKLASKGVLSDLVVGEQYLVVGYCKNLKALIVYKEGIKKLTGMDLEKVWLEGYEDNIHTRYVGLKRIKLVKDFKSIFNKLRSNNEKGKIHREDSQI